MASVSGHGFVGLNYPEIVHSSVVLVLKDEGLSLPTIPELRYPIISTDLTNNEVSLNNADQNAVRYKTPLVANWCDGTVIQWNNILVMLVLGVAHADTI